MDYFPRQPQLKKDDDGITASKKRTAELEKSLAEPGPLNDRSRAPAWEPERDPMRLGCGMIVKRK